MEIHIELFVVTMSISYLASEFQQRSYLDGSFGSLDIGWVLPEMVLQA